MQVPVVTPYKCTAEIIVILSLKKLMSFLSG